MQGKMQHNKLGRGLSALLGDRNESNKKDTIVELIDANKIVAGIYQPRKYFDKNDLDDLAISIKENGLIQPIIVRSVAGKDLYEIIAGERRFRASKIAHLKTIPAIIKKISDREAFEFAIIENVQREDLSPIEEADSYKRLIKEFSYTQDQVAKKIGKGRVYIANLLRVLELSSEIKNLVDKKVITIGHAKAIASSKNPEKLAKKIVDSSLSVREVEEIVKKEKGEFLEKNSNKKEVSKIVPRGTILKSDISKSEKTLSKILKTNVKISYNKSNKSGVVNIDFNDFKYVNNFIKRMLKII
jgi:ParB family chromosome partitioning protein